MFFPKAFSYLLLALVALLSVASASGDGYLIRRQNDDVSSAASDSASSTSASASASQPSTSDDVTSPTSSAAPSSTPPPSTSDRSSTSEVSSTPSSSENPATTQNPATISAQQSTRTGVVTVFVTTSGSSVYSVSSTLATSASASATGGVSQDNSGGSSGMTDGTKKIVIGVAVGVGGALLLGALIIVFWRMRNKKNSGGEADELMLTGRYGHEKTGSVDNSPFKSTLDQYHNPAGRVNQSANF